MLGGRLNELSIGRVYGLTWTNDGEKIGIHFIRWRVGYERVGQRLRIDISAISDGGNDTLGPCDPPCITRIACPEARRESTRIPYCKVLVGLPIRLNPLPCISFITLPLLRTGT
jgi:hypothetical protein